MIDSEEKPMTSNTMEAGNGGVPRTPPKPDPKKRRNCRVAVMVIILVLLAIVLVGIIVGVTMFKIRQPRTQIVSASLDGVSPRVSFPAVKIELNVTLNLTLAIQNRNHATFKSGDGEGVLLYQGNRIGDSRLNPGLIRAKRTSTLFCLLTVEVDRFANDNLTSLISDIVGGQLQVETKTRVPGRVTFLGIFHKHIVSTSDCQIVIGFPDLNIKSQDCKDHI